MKKWERHQIKRDELLTVMERTLLFTEKHLRPIALTTAAGLVVALIAVGGWRWRSGREADAAFQLSQVTQTYRAPVAFSLDAIQQAPAGIRTYATVEERDGHVVELADDLLKRFASTGSAPGALYYKGLALRGLGKDAQAAETFEQLLSRSGDDLVAPLARYQLGNLREAEGKMDEAIAAYEKLADGSGGIFPQEEALLGIGRCQATRGLTEEARKTYQRIIDEFPGSAYQTEARQRISNLS